MAPNVSNGPTNRWIHHGSPSLPQAEETVLSLRQTAEELYRGGNYRSSVQLFTKAIAICTQEAGPTTEQENSILSILVAHRAAALFMLGAYAASASEYQKIIPEAAEIAESSTELPPTLSTTYQRFLFMIYVCVGFARACLKLGDHVAAQMALERALCAVDDASNLIGKANLPNLFWYHLEQVRQLREEASVGLLQAFHLKMFFEGQSSWRDLDFANPLHQQTLRSRLDAVNMALSIAPSSEGLLEQKLTLLAQMQEWAEVIGVCERVAARNVGLDDVFFGDLAARHPFPGVSPAMYLTSNYFGNLLEEDNATRGWQIQSPGAAAEAVLRLPMAAQRLYLRALRLEEQFILAEAVLSALEQRVKHHQLAFFPEESMQQYSSWLPIERIKLKRTQDLRKHAHRLYKLEDFEGALSQSQKCLAVDADNIESQLCGFNVGGRLHLSLNCNLVYCFYQLDRFEEAIDVCNSILKHYPRCMTTLARRAKCYKRLERMFDVVVDYEQWLNLAHESKIVDDLPSSGFVLGGPYKVADDLIASVQKEYDFVKEITDATVDHIDEDGFQITTEETPAVGQQERREQREVSDSQECYYDAVAQLSDAIDSLSVNSSATVNAKNAVAPLEAEVVNQERPLASAANSVEAPREQSTISINEEIDLNYLRCVIIQCLSLPPESTERQSLIPVVGTLLNFEDSDYRKIEECINPP